MRTKQDPKIRNRAERALYTLIRASLDALDAMPPIADLDIAEVRGGIREALHSGRTLIESRNAVAID